MSPDPEAGARTAVTADQQVRNSDSPTPPRLAFLGVGWIGRNRLDAMVEADAGSVAAVADPSEEARAAVAADHPDAAICEGLEEMLDVEPDGLVIATPSALHSQQAIAALDRGIPVFCQKPLGRTAAEVESVVEAARRADRLLAVDMSYRHTAAIKEIRRLIQDGELGEVFAAELVFHNAYGPDKEWFYDRDRSGGGCVMDLGIHLVDLGLWLMGGEVERVSTALYARGHRLDPRDDAVEDYAEVRLDLYGGRSVRVTTSWNLSAGRQAVIKARFHGTRAGAAMANVDGSFYDFRTELYRGTGTEVLVEPPDDWGGRAAVAWARQVAEDPGFDSEVEEQVAVARVLDRIYGR